MAEYIDREAVLREVCNACNDQFDEDPCEPKDCSFRELIKALPAADVQPVRHGKWINQRADSEMCSACGTRFYISALFAVGGNDEPPYCPNCGARMDGFYESLKRGLEQAIEMEREDKDGDT